MRGFAKRKLVTGVAAGFFIIQCCSLALAGESGSTTNPVGTEPTGDPVNLTGTGTVELRTGTIVFQFDGGSGDPSRVISAEGAKGQPMVIRIVADDAPPAGKEGADDEIVRRLQERRRAELAGQAKPAPARTEARNPAEIPPVSGRALSPEQLRREIGELATVTVPGSGKMDKAAFLGVGASPAPAVLTHQLHLPADFGLAIDEVVPGGPADKAGLKQFDVLQKFDDQLLVDDRQLTALVHSRKPGDDVTLTVVREAKPLTLKVTLGEHGDSAQGEVRAPFTLQLDLPPGQGRDQTGRPALRFEPPPRQPDGERAPSPLAPPPLPGLAVPPPEGRKPQGSNADGPKPAPQAKSNAPAAAGNAADDEAKRLEEELAGLRATAAELRAELRKQEAQDEAGQQPGNREKP